MYTVVADIKYLDGSLTGLVIPAGHSTRHANKTSAMRVVRWIAKTYDSNDFVRATGTGNRYQFTTRPELRYSL